MKTTVNQSAFHDAFISMDRKENFTYEGREILFSYLEELEQDTGEELEMDVIALCCDYSEDTPEDIAANYSIIPNDGETLEDAVEAYLNNKTSIVGKTPAGDFVYCSSF